jgi:hypothetical protein
VILTKEFNTRLMALKVSGKKAQYTQAWTVLGEMTSGVPVSKNFRPESRLPNCYKFCLHLATSHSSEQPLQFLDLDVPGDEDVLGRRPTRSYLPYAWDNDE